MTTGDFELFCKRYQCGMYRVAIQVLHDSQQAEDAIQEAFIRIFRVIARLNFETEDAEKVYALRAAKNAAIDVLRRRKQTDDINDPALMLSSWEGNPYQTVADQESVREINHLLGVKAGAIFSYRSMGLLDTEIAATLNISVSNVRSIAYRARLHVADSLRQREAAQDG